MRIAYVYDALYPWVKGGAEKRVYELSTRLARRGHEVHCYGIRWWGDETQITADGVHMHGICPPMSLYKGGRRSAYEAAVFAWRVLCSLPRSYDVIDCQEFPYLSCFSARAKTIGADARLFITWHEVWGNYWYTYMGRAGRIGKAVEVACSRLKAVHIAVSNKTRDRLVRLGQEKVCVVPNGVDLRAIGRVMPCEDTSDLIFVGRLIREKNVDVLIKAVDLLRRNRPDLRCLILGDGPEKDRLVRLASSLQLEGCIEFAGFFERYEDVISRIKSSRALVLPSSREGFGIVVLEAAACGVPVISIDHPNNAACELITPATGLICQLSAGEMAQSISKVLDMGPKMRPCCLEQARSYDWEAICTRLETVYDR